MALSGVCNPVGEPVWTRNASIGDYGGAPDKRDCTTENPVPYTLAVYRSLVAQRGVGVYSTQIGGTLVHVEILASARSIACGGHRAAEKIRANATPIRADERLDYWVDVLDVTRRPSEQRWQLRQRAAAHYVASPGNTLANVRDAVSELLGDAFVDVAVTTGASLNAPPTYTYWPGVNPGSAVDDLGGGTWNSERCHYFVIVAQPSGMSDADFYELIRVHLVQLLDRMLPCWATFGFGVHDSSGGDSGFILDISKLDLAAMD